MKNEYNEISKLSMADEDDYDEYEEEVVERDEEYEDEDSDEEYEDEEYEDEEEYDEEEPEEEYDDGYDDQYYDDRLNQVLDELAELKRGMSAPAVQQQQQPFAPVQPHLLFSMPQQNNNEVVMYNEISRLRDELSKTQNEQSLHVELSRMKEDMEREKRQNEAQFLSEIKRLNERIEELEQPAGKHQLNQQPVQPAIAQAERPALLPEGESVASSKELNKLININESILKSTRDANSKILSDISDLKKSIASAPAGDLGEAVEEIRDCIKALQDNSGDGSSAIGDSVAEISAAIADLKDSIGDGAASGAPIDKKLLNKLARAKTENGSVDLTEIMRSVYELKGMLGSSDPNQQELVNMALKAYTDLDLLHATMANATDFRMKLEAIENFVTSVNAQDFITSDALQAFNIVLKDLLNTQLDHAVFDSLNSFATATGKITITSSKREAINKYLAFSERAHREELDSVMEFLPEMVTAINDAENSRNVTGVGSLFDDISSVNDQRKAASSDAEKRAAETEMKALISELADLRVGDVITYSPVMPLPTSDAVNFSEGDSVSDRLNGLIDAVNEIAEAVKGISAGGVPVADNVSSEAAATAEGDEPVMAGEVASADIESLRSMLSALSARINVDELTAEVKKNHADIVNRLAALEGRVSVPSQEDEDVVEGVVEPEYVDDTVVGSVGGSEDIIAAVQDAGANITGDIAQQATDIVDRISAKVDELLTDESRALALEDLAAIKEKVLDYEMFVSQIADLRADVIALPETINVAGASDKLYEDITAQFDKLYEDLSALSSDSEERLTAKLDEVKNALDSVIAADLSSSVLDGIVDFRAAYEEAQSLTAADRQKLLEDVAFIREDIEKRYAEEESAITNAEIADRLEAIKNEFLDEVRVLEDKVAVVEDSSATVITGYENVTADIAAQIENAASNITGQIDAASVNVSGEIESVSDKLSEKLEALAATVDEKLASQEEAEKGVMAAIEELKEKSAALEDTVNANGLLTAENQSAVTDGLNRIIAMLSPADSSEEGEDTEVEANVYNEILAVADKVEETRAGYEQANADIMAVLAEIKEQVHLKELEQSLATVSATEEEQQTLLTEIASLRERLSELENVQKEQADAAASQLTLISEIKDRLNEGAEASSEIVRMQDDLTFIRNQIEANIDGTPEGDSIAETLENENMTLIMDDIAAIKEKLAALEEYDAVAEILSLREDVKAARLLDSNDLAAELESLKGDLTELKADISDIKAYKPVEETAINAEGSPTSDEVNMLLSEIVSLRDEIQAYKDDVNNIVTTQSEQTIEPVQAVADENISVILDELTGLHSDIEELKQENLEERSGEIEDLKAALAEIKDMISRRTTLATEDAANETELSTELNVVLDEIINVKDEVSALKNDFTAHNENAAATRESDAQAEKAALADEMQAFKNELYALVSEKLNELASMPDITEDLAAVKEQLSDLQALTVQGVSAEDGAPVAASSAVLDELGEIKAMIAASSPAAADESASGITIEELYSEIMALRQDMDSKNSAQPVIADASGISVDLTPVNEQLAAINERLNNMPAAEAQPDETLLNEVLSLREELAAMREQMQAAPAEAQPDAMVLNEVLSLREELTALREQMEHTVAAEEDSTSMSAVLGEILALRDELTAMRENAVSEDAAMLRENVDAIKEDVRAIKEEPDFTIVNEVMALRDEFQAFKDELNKSRTAPPEDKSKEALMREVQSLRDQMFAISMANVNDGNGGEVVYESYNNIILDEISSLREELASIKQSDETSAIGEELSEFKDKLTNMAIDDREKTEASLKAIKAEIAALKKAESEAAQNAVVEELASLRQELNNRREADATTLNFMSEIAHLIERQNEYLGQASNERIADEIENLKSEIASSVSASADQAGGITIDNSAVLEEISALRAEMNKRNSDLNKILKELSRIKDEVGAINGNSSENVALSRSINDLKAELNELAGFVEEDNSSKPAAKAGATRPKQGGAKRKASAKPRAEKAPADSLSADSLISKIESTDIEGSGSNSDDVLILNPDFVPERDSVPATSEEMEIASRMAKQVANKLIMEQLVQQLGDNVESSEVEEIVKDILPQEFTTIQVNEQSDKVRRLANSLVLDKLRSRLKK